VLVFLVGIYIAYRDINIIAGEKFFQELAEGATTPENTNALTEGEGLMINW